MIPQAGPGADVLERMKWAEASGFDVAYVYDHLTHPTLPGQWLADAFTTLGAAAVSTERIELGTLVASATLHSPVALARRAATVQDLSGGRMVLGLGAGARFCAVADRDEEPTPGEMHARWRDVALGALKVWEGATEWTGSTRAFRGLETTGLPEGVERPFLLLAAHGPKALAFAAEHADGWNTYGGPNSTALEPDEFWTSVGEQASRMNHAVEQAERERPLRRSLLLGFGKVQPTASVAAYTEAIDRAEQLGFDELVVYAPGVQVALGQTTPDDPSVHERVAGHH